MEENSINNKIDGFPIGYTKSEINQKLKTVENRLAKLEAGGFAPASLKGSFTISAINSRSTWTQQINFSKAFASVPKVSCGSNSNYATCSASNITKAGFTFNAYNPAGSQIQGITCSWSAVA